MNMRTVAMIAKIAVATGIVIHVLVAVESAVVPAHHRQSHQQVSGLAERRMAADAKQRQVESDRRTFDEIINTSYY